MRIGFIGLGNIGGRCARHILAAGHELTVADLDESARQRLVEAGANAVEEPAGVAEASEVVVFCRFRRRRRRERS